MAPSSTAEAAIDGFRLLAVGGDKADLSGDGKDTGVSWITERSCSSSSSSESVDLSLLLRFFRALDEPSLCGGFGERSDVFSFRGDITPFVVVCGGRDAAHGSGLGARVGALLWFRCRQLKVASCFAAMCSVDSLSCLGTKCWALLKPGSDPNRTSTVRDGLAC